MSYRIALTLLLMAVGAAAGELRKAEAEMIRILEKVRPGVVTVVTPEKHDLDVSGVVVSSDGVILTLRKALLDNGRLPETLPVKLAGAKAIVIAEVIDSDVETDTALLRVKSVRGRMVKPGTVDVAKTGEWVLLVGNSFGSARESTPSASLGVVSGIVRHRGRIESIHISALVNPGSTGAPVIDFAGTLLGIVAPRPGVTVAGGQTIVIPIDLIRDAYRAKTTPGKRVFSARPAKRSSGKSLGGAFGLVMADAARKGAAVLVGVRAGAIPEDAKPPKETPKPLGPKGKGRRRRPKPPPLQVSGELPGFDRSSGVIVSADGYVLCPLRVTGWPKTRRPMTVDLMDGTSLPADIAAIDERLRVALLRVQRSGLPVLQPAARDTVRSGRFAVALGFPHERPGRMTPQVTIGILSRTNALVRLHPAMHALQTDAGIAGGNRGGPLVDIDGRLLGVVLDVNDTNTRGYGSRAHGAYAGNAGLGFALPVEVIEEIVPRLRKGIDLKSVLLGVSTIETEQGLRVVRVSAQNSRKEPTAAHIAGLKVNDYLLELSGAALNESTDLKRALGQYTVGDKIKLIWMRAGKRMSAEVVLGGR